MLNQSAQEIAPASTAANRLPASLIERAGDYLAMSIAVGGAAGEVAADHLGDARDVATERFKAYWQRVPDASAEDNANPRPAEAIAAAAILTAGGYAAYRTARLAHKIIKKVI